MGSRRAQAEKRPHFLIEGVVRVLTPMPVRESLLGDLAERYRSPSHYAADALSVLPFVISRHVSRHGNLALALLCALMLFGCLGGFVSDAVTLEIPRWARAGIPALFVLLGLVVYDAYRSRNVAPLYAALMGGGVACAALFFSQILLFACTQFAAWSGDWILPLRRIPFAVTGIAAICLVRLGFSAEPLPSDLRKDSALPPDALRESYKRFAKRTALRNAAECAMGLLLIGIAVRSLWTLNDPQILFLGWIWVCVHSLYLVRLIIVGGVRPIPEFQGFLPLREFFQGEIQRQHDVRRHALWWYLAPTVAGILLHGLSFAAHGVFVSSAVLFMATACGAGFLLRSLSRRREASVADAVAMLEGMRMILAPVQDPIGSDRIHDSVGAERSAKLIAIGIVGGLAGGLYPTLSHAVLKEISQTSLMHVQFDIRDADALPREELALAAIGFQSEAAGSAP